MTTDLPTVDVVIISWNRREKTLETIANIQEQTGIQAIIWLVDQGSTDGSLEALRELAQQNDHIHLHEYGENVGIPMARNWGMMQGNADYVVVIDNDAVFEATNAIAQAIAHMEADLTLAAMGFRIKNYTTHQDDHLTWVYPKSLRIKSDTPFLTTRFVGCGHIIRRAALVQTQGYDESLFFNWEELDLSYQFINLGYAILYNPAIVVLHKVAADMRVNWHGNRFYYLCRNAIYLNHKYLASFWMSLMLSVGYLLKGLYNGVLWQGIRGIWDAWRMIFRLHRTHNLQPLNPAAKIYLYEHELKYRGNLWQRIRQEALGKLP